MYYTTSRIPASFSNYKKYDSAIQRVRQSGDRDGEMMSPVNLSIEDATPVQLPPLVWTNYHLTPACMAVRNSGFTVMITANYDNEVPHISSGPLTGNYIFSQVHFHWGGHDGTGSGHAVDGIRFPLEMHVVHLKKDCANLGEALKTKDGIAVMVHLFTLREERNIHLDQLTAILQFIQQPTCCARLYPTPLSEIVHPFTNDYFLYWGAVGSPKGRYRILWFVSRNVLPVSAQQLEEFRQLKDPEGNLLMTNSSKPQHLGGRSLFLVSPSERTNETMHGVPRRPAQSYVLDEEDTLEIRNAEYKSLAVLEEGNQESCRICTMPKRVTHVANINVGPHSKVNEGDTSVEESCVDLSNETDDGLTVTTETNVRERSRNQKVITNVNVTTCRHNYKMNRQPSEVYQVISQRGSELHIKRKPVIVRKKDPSTEQACMLLGDHSATRTTWSAPSLGSTGGPLTVKQEHTNLANTIVTNYSSEVAVTHRDSEYGHIRMEVQEDRTPVEYYYSELENETDLRESTRQTKKMVTQRGFQDDEDYYSPKYIDNQNRLAQDKPTINSTIVPAQPDSNEYNEVQSHYNPQEYGGYYEEEEKYVIHDEKKDHYLLVKKVKGDMPRYKVLGRVPAPDNANEKEPTVDYDGLQNSNYNKTHRNYENGTRGVMQLEDDIETTEYKRVSERNENTFKEMYEEKEEVQEKKEQKETVYKSVNIRTNNNVCSVPITSQQICGVEQQNNSKQKDPPEQPKKETKENNGGKHEGKSDPHYRVSLVVRTTVSDHRNLGKKKGGNTQKYYVTKISPVEKSIYVSPNSSNTNVRKCYENKRTPYETEHLYYAQPINDDKQLEPVDRKRPLTKTKDIYDQKLTSEYYETSHEESYEKRTEENRVNVKTVRDKARDDKSIAEPFCGTQNLQPIPPKQILQDPSRIEESFYNQELNERENKDAQRQENVHVIHRQPQTVVSGNQILPNSLDNPQGGSKHLTHMNKNNSYEEHDRDKNLVKKVNVYHRQNNPDESVYMINKTVTGKAGQRKSTDVLVKANHVEIISPNKTNLERGVDYSLIKSKHPEPQYYVKEPPNKSQPSTVTRQHLSLDQRIRGNTQVRQSLEYQDDRGSRATGGDPKVDTATHEQLQQRDRAGISRPTFETYEESSQEQSSTVRKSHQKTFKTSNNIPDSTFLPNSYVYNLENKIDLKNIQQEKEDVLKFSALDPQSLIPSAYAKCEIKNPSTEMQLEGFTSSPQNKTNTNIITSKNSYLAGPPKIISSVNNPKNVGVSSYEYQDTSINNHREQTKREKKVMFKNDNDPNPYNNIDLDQTPQTPLVLPNKHSQELLRNTPTTTKLKLPEQTQLTTTDHDHIVPQSDANITDRPSDGGVDFEEIVEENEVYSSQTRTEKTRTVQVKGETSYKFPSQRTNVPNEQHSTPTLAIKKVEIPEPHYITRVPKQPLVEYEAYPVDPHQPFEIITETYGETTSTVKTNKTFMMFKKINGKAVLNQPSVIEPMKISNTGKAASGSFISQKSNNVVPYKNNGNIVSKEEPQSVQPSNYVTEEYNTYENFTEEEKREYKKRKQIHAYNVNSSGIRKQQEENIPKPEEPNVETDKPLQKKENHGQYLVQSHQQPSTSKIPQGVTQYEYSETSLVSEQNITQKEKKVKYTSRQPIVNENEDVEQPLDQTLRLEPGISSGICDDPQSRNRDATDIWGSTEKTKTKIVGTLKPDISIPASPENREGPTEVVRLPHQIVKPVARIPYSSEEYYESTTIDHKHESTKQRYVAVRATLLGGDIQQPGPTQLQLDRPGAPEPDQNKYPDIWDEPTKDLPITGEQNISQPRGKESHRNESLREDTEKNKRKSATDKSVRGDSDPVLPGDKNSQSRTNNTSPFTANDGNILIYIRQPKSQKEQVSPKITVDVRESNLMTSSELEAQGVQVHQMKKSSKKSKKSAGKPIIIPRKSKSAEYHKTFSSGTSESGVGSNAELDEERVIDTTHYNLTLKSHTEVELPKGIKNAKVKSKAEVKIVHNDQDIHQGHTASQCSAVGDEEEVLTDTSLSTPIETGAKQNEIGVVNQSPIKINTDSSVVRQYPSIQFLNQWDAEGYALLENNGRTLRVSYVDDSLSRPRVRGGPLEGDYIFGELHFHWGHKDCCGAEHIIDGHKGTVEGHFLYFKKNYKTAREALNHPDGIAILAVNLTVGGPPNPLLGELLKEIHLLREADTGAYVTARSVFAWIKPTIDSAKGYFSYKGSLTLEPYMEAVTWLIFPEPIIFCCQQSCEFRKLKSIKGEPLKKNFRLPQPLNNRPVYYVPIAIDV